MFDPEAILIYHHQHHRELLEQAQKHRFAELVFNGRGKQHPRYHETLAALGRQLVNWGEQLQARYSPVEWVISGENIQ